MSNGTYCIIRDLGLVKGGKGLRHHECLLRIPGLFSMLVLLAWPKRYRFAEAVVPPAQKGSPAGSLESPRAVDSPPDAVSQAVLQ